MSFSLTHGNAHFTYRIYNQVNSVFIMCLALSTRMVSIVLQFYSQPLRFHKVSRSTSLHAINKLKLSHKSAGSRKNRSYEIGQTHARESVLNSWVPLQGRLWKVIFAGPWVAMRHHLVMIELIHALCNLKLNSSITLSVIQLVLSC